MSIPNKVMRLKDGQILYNDLRQRIEELPSGENIVAPNYADLTFPVTQGQPCIHEGLYYIANTDIQSSEDWTAAHWTQLTVGEEVSLLKNAIDGLAVAPEMYGAKGDGVTDDSQAVQDAVDAGYNIKFDDNKTYYLENTVTVDRDIHLIGGINTTIKTKTPSGGSVNDAIVVTGTLKKTTTLTSDYSAEGTATDNAGNRFRLTDMTNVNIGDILIITATDQYYNYNRQYYYLGGTLLIADKDNDYIYTSDAMPWDIENTQNVTVEVYSAPTAIIENLHFVSDLDTNGDYKYCLKVKYCKNSEVRNCGMSEMDNGLQIYKSVNTKVDGLIVSVTPEKGEQNYDHYGVSIYSCTNTIISRVMGECANSCVDLSGRTPNMNTYIQNCSLFGSNRTNGMGMHENAYNTVVADCVLGGMVGYGTLIIQRCRFVQRNKVNDSYTAIIYRGSHNEQWARLTIEDCTIEGNGLQIDISNPVAQSPIQSYHNIVGSIDIRNCVGGTIVYNPSTSGTILSNRIKRIVLDNVRNCKEFYHTGKDIDFMLVNECSFNHFVWCNNHSGIFYTNGIKCLRVKNTKPQENKLFAEISNNGALYYLPENTPITFTTETATDHFVVCGKNIASDDEDDYLVGDVSGSVDSAITRTVSSSFLTSLSVNENNEIVFTQPNLTSSMAIYPKCFAYAEKRCIAKISCKLKNTGETNGSAYRMYIAVVDANTGKITYRGNGTGVTASASGAVATHTREVPANSFVLCYVYCYSAVANAETTLSEFVVNLVPYDFNDELVFEKYKGSSRDGAGTLESVDGANYIMAETSGAFTAKFKVDYLDSGFLQSAMGVEF